MFRRPMSRLRLWVGGLLLTWESQLPQNKAVFLCFLLSVCKVTTFLLHHKHFPLFSLKINDLSTKYAPFHATITIINTLAPQKPPHTPQHTPQHTAASTPIEAARGCTFRVVLISLK